MILFLLLLIYVRSSRKGKGTNKYSEKAVLTGVMRVAQESLFSGLNNLSVQTLLNRSYSKHFGFTETEVEEILNYYGLESQLKLGIVFRGKEVLVKVDDKIAKTIKV